MVTGYECSAEIMDFLDHYISIFFPLSRWAYMYMMLGVESQVTFLVVLQGNKDKTGGEATLVLIMQDYAYLDIPNEEKMIKSEAKRS